MNIKKLIESNVSSSDIIKKVTPISEHNYKRVNFINEGVSTSLLDKEGFTLLGRLDKDSFPSTNNKDMILKVTDGVILYLVDTDQFLVFDNRDKLVEKLKASNNNLQDLLNKYL